MYKILIEKNTNMTVTVKPKFWVRPLFSMTLKKGILLSIRVYEDRDEESPPSRRRKSTMIRSSLSSGSRWDQATRRPGLAQTYETSTYAVLVPKENCPKSMASSSFPFEKVEGQLKAVTLSLMTERMGWACGSYGLHLQSPTMEPALRYQAIQSRYPDHRCLLSGCRAGSLWPPISPWRWQATLSRHIKGAPHEKNSS